MPTSKDLRLKVHYSGGIAEEGLLDLYDGGESIQGLSRSLAISIYPLLNNGGVRRRVDHIEGAKFYLLSTRRGSFQHLIKILLDQSRISILGSANLQLVFWDLIQWSWSETAGIQSEAKTPFLKEFLEQHPDLEQELPMVLEPALEHVHRPIKTDKDIKIDIVQPDIGTVVALNADTYRYLAATKIDRQAEKVTGNITKYNILSGYGRVFVDEAGHTVPFLVSAGIPAPQKKLITKSMYTRERADGKGGKLELTIKSVKKPSGDIKRIIIVSATEIHD